MTLVTSSRKPVPELRSLCKDLAFSLGERYMSRGKTGLSEVLAMDRVVIIVGKAGTGYGLDVYADGEQVSTLRFSSFVIERRTDRMLKGLRTGNQTVYESLGRYLDVISTDPGPATLEFDGVQGRRYRLSLRS
jgi:U3 small nucleolar ribonucleoprotein protein IMP4